MGLIGITSHLNKSHFKAVFTGLNNFKINFSLRLPNKVVANIKCHILIPFPGPNSKFSSIYSKNKKIAARTDNFQGCLLESLGCKLLKLILAKNSIIKHVLLIHSTLYSNSISKSLKWLLKFLPKTVFFVE